MSDVIEEASDSNLLTYKTELEDHDKTKCHNVTPTKEIEIVYSVATPTDSVKRIPVCSCLRSTESIKIPTRRARILSTETTIDEYLQKRRIPQLIKFLFTKVLANGCLKPEVYLENLIDDCMLFRSGLGKPPILYKERHLRALVKSYDPGQRGWLSESQVRLLYESLGLDITPKPHSLQEKTPWGDIISQLLIDQENYLLSFLCYDLESEVSESSSSPGTSSMSGSGMSGSI